MTSLLLTQHSQEFLLITLVEYELAYEEHEALLLQDPKALGEEDFDDLLTLDYANMRSKA